MSFALKLVTLLANVALINALSDIAYIEDPRVQRLGNWATTSQCGNYTYGVGNGIELTFDGTGVAFIGEVGRYVGILSFALDDEAPEILDGYQNNTLADGGFEHLCNHVLYRSPTLPYGTHKLTAMTKEVGRGPPEPYMYFEYFSITLPSDAVLAPGSVGDSSAASPPGATGATTPPATVTAPAAVGIAVGGAAAGSFLFAFGLLLFPIIRRKALSHGSVTGVIQSGLYRVINDRHLNAAVPPDDSDSTPIAGISYGRLPEHKWDIILQENGRYHIKNHGYTKVYVGWDSVRAEPGINIINYSREDRDWYITEKDSSHKYKISTKSGREELFWTLTDEDRGTPITLGKSSDNTSQLWTLCLLEPLNTNTKA